MTIHTNKATNDEPKLYNATLLDIYAQYLNKAQPEINFGDILREAGIRPMDTVDPNVWLTQSQVNKFHSVANKYYKSRDRISLARAAARAASRNINKVIHRTTMSLLSCNRLFAIFDKIAKLQTRAVNAQTRQTSPTSYEIIVAYKDGVSPEPYQCDSMWGYIETMCLYYTNKLPHIEHPECVFKGDPCCRYFVSWELDIGNTLTRVRNIALSAGVVFLCVLFFLKHVITASIVAALLAIFTLGLSLFIERKERKRISGLVQDYENQFDPVTEGYNRFYDYTDLFGDIARYFAESSSVSDILEKLSISLTNLGFRKGLIFLVGDLDRRFRLSLMYGYDRLPIDMPFRVQRYFKSHKQPEGLSVQIINNDDGIYSLTEKLFPGEKDAKELTTPIYLPIVYEKNTIGFGLISCLNDKLPLADYDLSLLEAIIAQSALAITNIASLETIIQTERLKNQFVTVASHELRTPIQAIMLGYDGLTGQMNIKDRDKYQSSLEVIDQGIIRLDRIVTNILSLSKIEASNSLDESSIAINELIDQIRMETAHIIKTQKQAMEISVTDVGENYLLCDGLLMLQVFTNLVNNAVKFTPEDRKIIIHFHLTAADLSVDIVDNGIGIPGDEMEKIFLKFFQIKRDGLFDHSGCGLGLSFCQEVIRKHGGYISVDSPVPENEKTKWALGDNSIGSKFTIHLPLERLKDKV